MGNRVGSYLALFLVFIGLLAIFSGCVEKGSSPTSTPTVTPTITSVWSKGWSKTTNESESSSVGDTVLATIDSLPPDATVFIEYKEKPGEALNTIGSTPLKVKLTKGKRYTVWTVVSIEQYRKMTRNIPEIQKRLDEFQRNEKTGAIKPGYQYFFEKYTEDIRVFESDEYPGQLQGIGIPIDVYVSTIYEDKMRIASVFVPADMNPDVLLPLVDKNKSYNYSKADLISIMNLNFCHFSNYV